MAAPESTKFQVNFKLADGTLINVYATNQAELEAQLTAIQDVSTLIQSVSQSFGSSASTAPVQSAKSSAAPALKVVEGSAPACKHGNMSYRTGTSARGPWKGWMCAAPKGAADKCDTIWA